MRRRLLSWALGSGALWLLGCKSKAQGTASTRPARLRLAIIPKGTTHEFWKSVHAGAVKASKEVDVDVVWKGALAEDDLKAQIDVVQSFVAQKVNGIVLAPLSEGSYVLELTASAGPETERRLLAFRVVR